MKKKQKILLWVTVGFSLLLILGNTALSQDRGEKTYYFDSCSPFEAWETNPGYMVDENPLTYASTTTCDTQYLNGNNYDEDYNYTITKVWIRIHAKYSGNETDIILTPIRDHVPGNNYRITPGTSGDWSEWINITADWPTQSWWTWDDIRDLECVVMADCNIDPFTLYCSVVQIAVWFIVP